MQHPPVVVAGYSEAAMLLRGPRAGEVVALLTIAGQREYCVDTEHLAHRLDLKFDDVESPDPADPIQSALVRRRIAEAAAMGLSLEPPAVEHARAIVEFAQSIARIEGTLLCHCQAGISRSPAAALLCLAAWTGEGHEEQNVEHVLELRPAAMPHPGLVALGDELLGRGGKLVAALQRHRPYW